MDAKARYESIHQRKGERILDYVARFQKARIESGHRDGPNAAMKFFRNLTIDVDHMPWKAEYTTVDAVANAVAGLDLTAKIRAKRKRREEEEEEEEKSEDEKQKFTSRLARLEQDKLAKKRALKKGESLDEGDGDPAEKNQAQFPSPTSRHSSRPSQCSGRIPVHTRAVMEEAVQFKLKRRAK